MSCKDIVVKKSSIDPILLRVSNPSSNSFILRWMFQISSSVWVCLKKMGVLKSVKHLLIEAILSSWFCFWVLFLGFLYCPDFALAGWQINLLHLFLFHIESRGLLICHGKSLNHGMVYKTLNPKPIYEIFDMRFDMKVALCRCILSKSLKAASPKPLAKCGNRSGALRARSLTMGNASYHGKPRYLHVINGEKNNDFWNLKPKPSIFPCFFFFFRVQGYIKMYRCTIIQWYKGAWHVSFWHISIPHAALISIWNAKSWASQVLIELVKCLLLVDVQRYHVITSWLFNWTSQ